jgi:hypothetical protein
MKLFSKLRGSVLRALYEEEEGWNMNGSVDRPYGPYAHLYQQFFEHCHEKKGYNFGEAPRINMPPPLVRFPRHKWWSWDRPKRLRKIRLVRDQSLMEILRLGDLAKTFPHGEISGDQHTEKRMAQLTDKHATSQYGGSKDSTYHSNNPWAA